MARSKKRVIQDESSEEEEESMSSSESEEEDGNNEVEDEEEEEESVDHGEAGAGDEDEASEDFEQEPEAASDEEAVPDLKDDRIWTPCRHCGAYTLLKTCGGPCPPEPIALRFLPNKTEAHLGLFEAVCTKGGFGLISKDEFASIAKSLNLHVKVAKNLYENNLWNVERQQTALLVKNALKGGSGKAPPKTVKAPVKKSETSEVPTPCGKCEGCTQPNCGTCEACEKHAKVVEGVKEGDSAKEGEGATISAPVCEKRKCIELISKPEIPEEEIDHLIPWQRGLLTHALWGIKPNQPSNTCTVCSANIVNLSLKKTCATCGIIQACNSCLEGDEKETWVCEFCQREDAPCWNGISICTSCGHPFTQTRTYLHCVDCLAPFCISCVPTELVKDPEDRGSGLRCFYCRTWTQSRSRYAMPIEPGRSKRLRVVARA